MEKKSKQSVKESRYEFVCRQYFKQVNQSADRFCVELSWQWISELHKLAILYTCVVKIIDLVAGADLTVFFGGGQKI